MLDVGRIGLIGRVGRTQNHGVAINNLAIFPNEFDNAAWGKNGTDTPVVSANAFAGPDGVVNADVITFGAAGSGNSGGYVYQARDVMLPGLLYWIDLYARVASGTKAFRLAAWDGAAEHNSSDLVATTAWQRFAFSFTTNAGATAGQDYGIRNQVGGGAGDLIVSLFRLYTR